MKIILLLIAQGFICSAIAQTTVHILEDPSCQPCFRPPELVVTFGDEGGPGIIESVGWLSVRKDQHGRYYVGDRSSVKVFDVTGTHLRTIGRPGRGPGEYRSIQNIEIMRDSLHIFDSSNRRHSIVSPTFEFVASRPVHGGVKLGTVLNNGVVVIMNQIQTPDLIGYPFHTINTRGERLRSFGADNPVVRPDMGSQLERYVTPSRGDRFWAAHWNRYQVELWDTSGTQLDAMVRVVDWFDPEQSLEWFTETLLPTSMGGIREDSQGNLRTLAVMSDERWEEGVVERTTAHGPGQRVIGDYRMALDAVLEVVDPRSHRVLMSQRFDQAFRGLVTDNELFEYWEDEMGVPRISVWRVCSLNGCLSN